MASIDSSEHGSTINVVTWFLLVAATLAVITRLATKLAISHRLNTDDFVVFSALVRKLATKSGQFVRGLTVSAFVYRPIRCSVYPGTSQPANQYFRCYRTGKISEGASMSCTCKRWRDSVADLLQSTYASGLLYIPSLLLAKLSVSLLLRLITPNILHKKLILGVEIVTVFWAISSEIAAAFQCHLPVPWKFLGGNTCFDLVRHYLTWLRGFEHWQEQRRRRSGLTLGLWILSQTWLLCYYHLALSGNYRLLLRGKSSLLDALHLE